ncbi:SDR family NAD(P)-dependent oxidoreductase [Dokdonella sp. MW10]|uniref:SDR family NAD(P)-dependent oxidoreductase n=1 Tax=Dokdonella sp. MW10 TaxID=2992926 RepID=UPI003F81FED5
MTAIVIGASSGLGRALAEELARNGHALLLVASDVRDLVALAADLRLRHGVAVEPLALDLSREPDPGARVLEALGENEASALLMPVGVSREDDAFGLGAGAIGQLLAINLHAPLAIAHALLPRLLVARGAIVGFGSIAAVRGRGRNVVYAAAKRGLETFFESLRHRHAPSELRVQFWKPGFLRSNLTFAMKLPMAPAEPSDLAADVVRRLPKGSFDRYAPVKWALVARVLRALPWSLFRRVKA